MKFRFIGTSNLGRRRVLRDAFALAVVASPLASLVKAADENVEEVTFAAGPRPLVQYPQKRPLTLVTTRPPHLETPFSVFNEGPITPNDAFFVRYHLANFPTSIDPDSYRLTVKGSVNTSLSLSLAELKALAKPIEVVAVNQCSGNSRGFSMPRVFGAQLGNGSMGNARWVGVSVKTILEKAGVNAEAKQVTFRGLDKPVLASTPEFIKALDISHAMDGEPMIAWSMNGTDLPFLNGYPIRLVVPGYFGTYWIKHLSEIEVLDHTFDGFFMAKGYQVPDNECFCVAPGTTAAKTRPISKLPVRSFITSVKQGQVLPLNKSVLLKGIAFDGGGGVNKVQVSIDGGQRWQDATLGEDLGRFSFREWTLPITFTHNGATQLMVRASNSAGETQPLRADWNPGGYRRHVVETTHVTVA
ncbi:SorA family sulfite dehydrogenase catalytic subunit [Pseudomonas tussilaginis]|uniref:SorA family sulfite dehydrogenase catalytic subunit n=1 Tax=Pseudomonas putida TaxID=303 RepID=UPI0023640FE2|nr:molybdopterin-dependent oxidoreductase [Pseudomonas putida]MDD1978504.1 molybdopterin-dependent oxidoreductase [Pseudomonas putida]